MKRFAAVIVSVVFLLLLGATLTHPGRVALKTALLLPEVLPTVPVKPLSWFTQKPIREKAYYTADNRQIEAALYRPGTDGKHGGVILLLGVNPDLEDPVFLRVVEGLARAGVVSLAPISAELNEGRIAAGDVDTLVAAFQYLEDQPFVDRSRIGYAGFCIGATFSLLAAEDQRISERVAFVNAFGSYYNAFDLLEAISTRRVDYDGVHQAWSPNQLTLTAFTNHLLNGISDTNERDTVREALSQPPERSRLKLATLSQESKAVYALLSGTDSGKARGYLNLLPTSNQEILKRLSPNSALGQIRAKVFLMVDTGDTYIPFVESRKLANALPPEHRVYTEFSIFEHVSPSRNPNPIAFAPEVVKLYRHLFLVMLEIA